ncbi:MAG: DUF4065 domain-containing protein [Actinomycetota bacterium]|nr:DUF4065 domain-containing protein [Actinomycetota bacterium]
MATVFDVSKYILEKQGALPTLKLQKLVYYAHAWSLVWDGAPLYDEEIQAWRGGPVVPALYSLHRNHVEFGATNLTRGDSGQLTEEQRDTVDAVLKYYGHMAPWELSNLTHQEAPWLKARERAGAGPGDNSHEKILDADIYEYYSNL